MQRNIPGTAHFNALAAAAGLQFGIDANADFGEFSGFSIVDSHHVRLQGWIRLDECLADVLCGHRSRPRRWLQDRRNPDRCKGTIRLREVGIRRETGAGPVRKPLVFNQASARHEGQRAVDRGAFRVAGCRGNPVVQILVQIVATGHAE